MTTKEKEILLDYLGRYINERLDDPAEHEETMVYVRLYNKLRAEGGRI